MLYLLLVVGTTVFFAYYYRIYIRRTSFLKLVEIDAVCQLNKHDLIESSRKNYSGYISFYIKNKNLETIKDLVFTEVKVSPEYVNVKMFPLYFERIEVDETGHRSIGFTINKRLADQINRIHVRVKGYYRGAENQKHTFIFQKSIEKIIITSASD